MGEGVAGAAAVSDGLSVGVAKAASVEVGVGALRVEEARMAGWAVRVAATEVASRFGGGSAAGRVQPANTTASSQAALRKLRKEERRDRLDGFNLGGRERSCQLRRGAAIGSAGSIASEDRGWGSLPRPKARALRVRHGGGW